MAIFKKLDKSENREIFYIDYYDENGKRVRESTESGSRSFALELLIKRKDEVAKWKKLPERYMPKMKLSFFVDNEYLPIHVKGLKSESDLKGVCKKLKAYFGDKYLHEINSRMVEIYKKERIDKVSGNTINITMSSIR